MADSMLSIGVEDFDGDRRRVPFFFDGAVTPAAISAFSTAVCPILDAAIDGKIVESQVTTSLVLPGGLKAAPVANCEVQKGANLSFLNPSRYKWGVYIPSVTPGLFIADNLDTTAAVVQALVTAYITGIGGTLPTNGLGFDLTALSSAKKAFRK